MTNKKDPFWAIGFTQGILERIRDNYQEIKLSEEQRELIDEAINYQNQLLEYFHTKSEEKPK